MNKTFRMVKVGDRIYKASIKDSVFVQDGAGGVAFEYVVKEVEQIDFYTFRFTLVRLKIKLNQNRDFEYTSEEDTGSKPITLVADGNNQIKVVSESNDSGNGLYNIDGTYFATTKTKLKNTLIGLIESCQGRADEIKTKASTISNRMYICTLKASSINTRKEIEMEETVNLEEAASMAL